MRNKNINKITGIKSVDFKIKALGHGVVNWNGPTTLVGEDGKNVDNHILPKLRGYSNLSGKIKEENGYKFKKEPTDINFKETPLYISQNCIRHHIFRHQAFDLQDPEIVNNLEKVLCSITGLIRGYVITKSNCKRTSPLLITDFVDMKYQGNFEQMGRCGSKEKEKTISGKDKNTTFFSKTTFGDTEYLGYASISIEQLQFISLDDKFSRSALSPISEKESIELSNKVADFIKEQKKYLKTQDVQFDVKESDINAVFHKNYVRKGSIFNDGESGILLNNAAIDVLVKLTIKLLENLQIRQGKGYMFVSEVETDYNNGDVGKDMMRIKHNPNRVSSSNNQDKYAVYFEGK